MFIKKPNNEEDNKSTVDSIEAVAVNGNSLIDSRDIEELSGFVPGNVSTSNKEGFSTEDTAKQLKDLAGTEINPLKQPDVSTTPTVVDDRFPGAVSGSKRIVPRISHEDRVRAAMAGDLALIDESILLDLPTIKSLDYSLPAIMFLKPKDPSIRFRWVYFNNNDNSKNDNYDKFSAVGFENATIDDVDEKVTPVGKQLKRDGSMLKYRDVLLMKVHVNLLMGKYKHNMESALFNMGRFQQKAVSKAQATFDDLISQEGLTGLFSKLKAAGVKVEFYVPGIDESKETFGSARA